MSGPKKSCSAFWAYLIDLVELIPNIYVRVSENDQKWPQEPKKCSKWPKSGFTARDLLNFFPKILPKGHNTELLESVFDADSEYIYEDV